MGTIVYKATLAVSTILAIGLNWVYTAAQTSPPGQPSVAAVKGSENAISTKNPDKKETRTAYLTGIQLTGSGALLTADYVQLLTGKAAVKAARKTGGAEYTINKKDTVWYVPNDAYLANENKRLRTLALPATAGVWLLNQGSATLVKSSIAQLKATYSGRLFRLQLREGVLFRVDEVYLP